MGILNFRHELTPFYANSGHIGLSVRPSERRNGYAAAMLRESLTLARAAGLTERKLVCRESNIASAKTILKNGGSLFRTFEEENIRYTEYRVML